METYILFGIRYINCGCFIGNEGPIHYFVGIFSNLEKAEEKLNELENAGANKYFIMKTEQDETCDQQLVSELANERYNRPVPEDPEVVRNRKLNAKLYDEAIAKYYASKS